MKIFHWTVAAVFALFTLAQYNDPDPLPWMLVYGGVACWYGLAAGNRYYRPGLWMWLGAASLWAVVLFQEFWNWLQMGAPSIVESMKADKPYIEFTREFLGLLLAAAACGWLLFKSKGSPPASGR